MSSSSPSSSTQDHAALSTPLFITTFKMKIGIIRRDAFDGRNGLILTGVLTGVGTIVCLLCLTLVIIYIRKRYKRRRKSKHGNGQSSNSFSKIKERISSDVGHHPSHLGKSHFSHSPPIGNASSSISAQPSLHITDQRNTNYFTQQAIPPTPPFQNVLPHNDNHNYESSFQAPQQPTTRFQPYSSSVPISTIASPRRKISQSNYPLASQPQTIGLAITSEEAVLPPPSSAAAAAAPAPVGGSGRPSSYLPVPRGLTPLSMNFVYRTNGGSSSPSASFSQSYGYVYGYAGAGGGSAGGGSTRPGFVAMPSSELMHEIQENAFEYDTYSSTDAHATGRKDSSDDDDEGGHAISPFQNVVYANEALPSPHRHENANVKSQRRPLKPIQLWEQQQKQQQQQTATRSSISPSSMNLSFSYPSNLKRPNDASPASASSFSSNSIPHPRSHAHSRSTPLQHTKADSSATNISGTTSMSARHLRNRSNGTVVTYASNASSAYTQLSNTTARIQPVAFDDSPRSSFGVNRAMEQQQQQHHQQESQQQQGWQQYPNSSSESRDTVTKANLARNSNAISTLRNAQGGGNEGAPSVQSGYRFPTVSATNLATTAAQSHRGDFAGHLQEEELVQNVKRQGRRASGKLPDMLFSRTVSAEQRDKTVSPASSPSTTSTASTASGTTSAEEVNANEEEEDIANMDDESVLDPMDDIARREDRLLYADIRLSATSSIFGGNLADETLKEDVEHGHVHAHGLARPRLGGSNPSASSLMTSTSSSSTNASYYGMAV